MLKRQQGGFSLIETMVAALIAVTGLFGMVAMSAAAASSHNLGISRAQSAEAARTVAEPLIGMSRVAALGYVGSFPRVVNVGGKDYSAEISAITDGGGGQVAIADYATAVAPITITLSVKSGVNASESITYPSFTIPF